LVARAVQFGFGGRIPILELERQVLARLPQSSLVFTFHYRKDVQGAANLGLKHGLQCLGCCWALMLVMFAVGSNDLVWMVALTGITMIERLGPHGDLLRKPIGIGLLLAATFLGYTLLPR
jgi:predicted metal-binding membrane protein